MRYSGKNIKNNSTQNKAVVRLLLEAGLLKNIRRSGWWVVGIRNPESVAEHCFRTALLGYFLAKAEQADPYPVLVMTLCNDLHEARINDLHKMGQRYINFSLAEKKAFNEQIQGLPLELHLELKNFREELVGQNTKEALVARDADILECLLQAKEYYERGEKLAQNFFQKAPRHLKTASAKKLWSIIKKSKIDRWWMRLSDFKR
jgi:putative hydrolase of HD superfamily